MENWSISTAKTPNLSNFVSAPGTYLYLRTHTYQLSPDMLKWLKVIRNQPTTAGCLQLKTKRRIKMFARACAVRFVRLLLCRLPDMEGSDQSGCIGKRLQTKEERRRTNEDEDEGLGCGFRCYWLKKE